MRLRADALLVLLATVAACGSASDGEGPSGGVDSSSGDDTDSGVDSWVPPEAELPDYAPQWTAEEAAEIASSVFSPDTLPSALTVMEVYSELMARGDESCPGDPDIIKAPLTGCVSESGMEYVGVGHLVVDEEHDDEGGLTRWSGYTAIADFQMYTPEGETFVGAGTLVHGWSWSEAEGTKGSTILIGSWRYSAAPEPWLKDGISTSFQVASRDGGADGQGGLEFKGTLGTSETAVYFEEFDVALGDCAGHPSGGSLHLRQDDGSWVELEFEDGACSSCAQVSWNGVEDLGEGCLDVDFQQWLDVLSEVPS